MTSKWTGRKQDTIFEIRLFDDRFSIENVTINSNVYDRIMINVDLSFKDLQIEVDDRSFDVDGSVFIRIEDYLKDPDYVYAYGARALKVMTQKNYDDFTRVESQLRSMFEHMSSQDLLNIISVYHSVDI